MNSPSWKWKNWQYVDPVLAGLLALPLAVCTFKGVYGFISTFFLVLAFVGFSINIYFFFFYDNWKNHYKEKINFQEILKIFSSGDINKINEKLTIDDLSLDFPKGQTLYGWAVLMSDKNLFQYLIEKKITVKNFEGVYPLSSFAMVTGDMKMHKIIVDEKLFSLEKCEERKTTKFMVDCFEGNSEEVKKNVKAVLVQQKDDSSLTALHYALLGACKIDIISELLSHKPNINTHGMVLRYLPKDSGEPSYQVENVSPVFLAFDKLTESQVLDMLSLETTYDRGNDGITVLMKAIQKNFVTCVKHLISKVDVLEKDKKFRDALDYAKLSKNSEIEKIIREKLEDATKKQKEAEAKERSRNLLTGNVDKAASGKIDLQYDDVRMMLKSTLRGMVNIDPFLNNFAEVVQQFFNTKNRSKGIVLWGNPAVGKTEITRRLSGYYKENIVAFNLPGIQIKYIACCDQTVDVKKIIDNIQQKSIIFLDEIDKYLSPDSGIVNESQAKGLRNSLVTNFESKEVLWVFTGSFLDVRGSSRLNKNNLEKMLGPELASRLDFADFQLNDWDIHSLLTAAQEYLSRDKTIDYDDDALSVLVQYILERKSGVRGLEKAHDSLKRNLRQEIGSSSNFFIKKNHVEQMIARELDL